MKILEKNKVSFDNAVMQPLSSDDARGVNGGWCFILICGVNFSTIFGPIVGDDGKDEIPPEDLYA